MKVMVVFGTRPEGIKMAPVIKELKNREGVSTIVVVTAQHREMLDKVLELFEIVPDYDLNIFKHGQTLTDITTSALKGLEEVMIAEKPDVVLVQGDTTTVFSGALAAFYQGIPVGHVEAGLRTGNLYSPYPEEGNRRLTGAITEFHFAPTESSRDNLIKENTDSKRVYVTGNTVIDALLWTKKDNYEFQDKVLKNIDYDTKRVILLTSHRKENLGLPMENIFKAVKDITAKHSDVEVIFPMHLNPKVRTVAEEILGGIEKVHLIEPLDYEPIVNLMARVCIVVTDSGGLQEEAPAFGKPVLVIRNETERPEGIEAGTAKLVGTSYQTVYDELDTLLSDETEYSKMANSISPYGDGAASKRIAEILIKNFK